MGEVEDEHTDQPAGPCPAWCRRDHAVSAHADDRLHQSEPRRTPVVLRRQPQFFEEQSEVAAELLVLAVQAGSDPLWIQVLEPEDARTALTLSIESVRRLCADLEGLLATLGGVTPGQPD